MQCGQSVQEPNTLRAKATRPSNNKGNSTPSMTLRPRKIEGASPLGRKVRRKPQTTNQDTPTQTANTSSSSAVRGCNKASNQWPTSSNTGAGAAVPAVLAAFSRIKTH